MQNEYLARHRLAGGNDIFLSRHGFLSRSIYSLPFYCLWISSVKHI